jgi:SAM-dependent methyltransferase
MKGHRDVFGQALFDYFNGREDSQIVVERSDGEVGPDGGPKVYFSEYKDWPPPPIEKRAMRYVRGRVLDVGCGAGRHALYLQDKGHEVVGIDNSPLAIEVCRCRGLKDARLLSIGRISSRLGRFDTILMFGGNFGLVGNFEKGKRLLRRFAKITSRRGRILASSVDPYDTDDPMNLEYHKTNQRKGRMSGQIRLRVRYKTYKSAWFDWLIVSKDEMREMLKDTGWKLKRTIETTGPRYMAVIQKE